MFPREAQKPIGDCSCSYSYSVTTCGYSRYYYCTHLLKIDRKKPKMYALSEEDVCSDFSTRYLLEAGYKTLTPIARH